jgi:hypothetical protein
MKSECSCWEVFSLQWRITKVKRSLVCVEMSDEL